MAVRAAVGQPPVADVDERPRRSLWPFAVGGAMVAIEVAWIVLLGWAGLAILS
jgi:hypothetical protein